MTTFNQVCKYDFKMFYFSFFYVFLCEEFEFPVVGQFCKNIVLAGVGSLTLVDDRVATEEVLSSNFLIPPDENAYSGKTLGELCCNSLKDFNPMVRVSIEKGFCFELVPLFVWFLLLHCFHVVLDIMFCGWSFLLFVFASGDLSSFDVEFFSKFDVVVVSCCSLSAKVMWKTCVCVCF